MTKLICYMVFSLVLTVFSFSTYARSCSNSEYDKAEYFAEKAGYKIIDKYGGGIDKRVKLSSCDYNSYSGYFKLKIEIYWSGKFFRDNKYNVDGALKFSSDGSGADFSRTYANQNVKDLGIYQGIAAGFAIAALASEQSSRSSSSSSSLSSSSSSLGYSFKFTNSCSHPVDLMIRYKKTNGDWEIRGEWEFSAYESATLSGIRSNSGTFYYYARTTDGDRRWVWEGDYSFSRYGETYKMKKITDTSGDNDWSITCGG